MPLFDPATGLVVDRDALRSVQFNGQGMTVPRSKINRDGTKSVEVIAEGGRSAGHHTHHPDGRVDATAIIPAADMSAHSTGAS